LTTSEPVSFSRRTLLHGVRKYGVSIIIIIITGVSQTRVLWEHDSETLGLSVRHGLTPRKQLSIEHVIAALV